MSACSSIQRDPVSIADLNAPQLPGIENARFWGDRPPENIAALADETRRQLRASGLSGQNTTLALSGGAENGAYGAGVLMAWSESGTRPVFQTVTGVSTGALTAPFAFLGPKYDDDLRRFYGGLEPDQIFRLRSLLDVLPNASRYSSDPLRRTIEVTVTEDFLEAIAKEHKRGRRLLVQTVSLDAERPVIWNMGAIAASGAPNAAEVFTDILLASSAIPGVFPPVLIDVTTPDGIRDELHVDGSVFSQSSYLGRWRGKVSLPGRPTLYIIRNGKVVPESEITKSDLPSIVQRSLSAMLKTQGTSELELSYEIARSTGTTYRATWIGDDFNEPLEQPFDPGYMTALFDYGYERYKAGNFWKTRPP